MNKHLQIALYIGSALLTLCGLFLMVLGIYINTAFLFLLAGGIIVCALAEVHRKKGEGKRDE